MVACLPGNAQTSGGIEGTVANAYGAALPNVAVSVRSLRTGEMRTILTNQQGAFSARGLSPGPYELRASLQGFSPFTATAAVQAGVTRRINVLLQREGVSAERGDSSTGGSVSSKTVRDLPSNGRDWTQAATPRNLDGLNRLCGISRNPPAVSSGRRQHRVTTENCSRLFVADFGNGAEDQSKCGPHGSACLARRLLLRRFAAPTQEQAAVRNEHAGFLHLRQEH